MLKLLSPAKINLFLKIVGKRPDGFHELSSLFQTIDLVDILSFEPAEQDSLSCTDPSIPTNASNLVLKATDLFRRKTGIKTGLKIHLDKKIPIEAGLGGGSGNAATALWAFNQLSGRIASTEQLQSWSAEIGSDIPFFFSLGTAHCTGRGEHVKTISEFPTRSCWIVKPKIGLSTPEVYKKLNWNPNNNDVSNTLKDLETFTKTGQYYNDLERPAFEIRPELKILKAQLLQSGFDTVLMTGSGSAFFCFGDGAPDTNSDIALYPASFINREPHRWYDFDNDTP